MDHKLSVGKLKKPLVVETQIDGEIKTVVYPENSIVEYRVGDEYDNQVEPKDAEKADEMEEVENISENHPMIQMAKSMFSMMSPGMAVPPRVMKLFVKFANDIEREMDRDE